MSDGVFAFAITVLVLALGLGPQVHRRDPGGVQGAR
ncbi:MAG: hypothetical protein HY263_05100 [Chloroflexi bacterium]|nr:hypothetical protein [Chloroflexota bacterium]